MVMDKVGENINNSYFKVQYEFFITMYQLTLDFKKHAHRHLYNFWIKCMSCNFHVNISNFDIK